MKKILVLFLKLLTTGTITLFIAACYGVMSIWDSKAITARSPEGMEVKGLKVTFYDVAANEEGTAVTDAAGVATFQSPASMNGWKAVLEDVDGQENQGKFAEAQVTFGAQDEYLASLTRE